MSHFCMTAVVRADSAAEAIEQAETIAYPYCEDNDNGYPGRWDWFVVGGRWSRVLPIKDGADPKDYSKDGETSLFDTTEEADGPNGADAIRRHTLELGISESVTTEAHSAYDRYEAITKGLTVPAPIVFEGPDEAQKAAVIAFRESEWFKTIKEAGVLPFLCDPIEFFCVGNGGRERFVRNAQNNAAFSTYGFLLEGSGVFREDAEAPALPDADEDGEVWVSAGEMGLFGVSVESNDDNWPNTTQKLIDALSPDVWLVTLDMHS